MKKLLLITLIFLAACQKQTLDLAEIEEPRDSVKYTEEVELNK